MKRVPGHTNAHYVCCMQCGAGFWKFTAEIARRPRNFCSNRCCTIAQRATKPAQFWGNTKRDESGCIEWTRYINPDGYGRGRWNYRQEGAHRIAWRLTHGEIATGMYVLHKCDNRRCVNPDHLYLGTQFDNMRDASMRGRFNARRTA